MRNLTDALAEGFDDHAVAMGSGAGPLAGATRSILRSIRRRRAARAGATAGASVLAVGAFVFTAITVGPFGSTPPGALPMPTDGAYPWCDLSSYPPVNPDALGAFPYAGRIWANAEDDEYVYVAPDGSRTTLALNASGTFFATEYHGLTLAVPASPTSGLAWKHTVTDFGTDGSSSSAPYAVGADEDPYYQAVTPALLYEWTTTAPSEVPPGVDEYEIAALQLASLGFDVSLSERAFVPDGASLEQVTRWRNLRERVVPVPDGQEWLVPPISASDLDGLASVALRVVGLPDGESYEVVSTYDPAKTWATACGTALNAGPTEPPPVASLAGPYFEGPESQVFSCSAAMPAEYEDAIPAVVAAYAGTEDVPDPGGTFDFGAGGVTVRSSFQDFALAGDNEDPPYPGWYSWSSVEADGTHHTGAMTFGALAWVDQDGRLIGREAARDDRSLTFWETGTDERGASAGVPPERHGMGLAMLGDLASRGAPCDGVDASALASASIAWVQGVGPDLAHMTWSWTRVWPPAPGPSPSPTS